MKNGHFSLTHSLVVGFLFFAIFQHLSFCFPLHIPTFSRVSSSFFFFLFAFRTQFIPHLSSYDILSLFLKCDSISHNLRSDPSWYLLPSVEGDPWSGIRRKIIKLKRGSNRIIFYEWEDREKWPFFISNIVT